MGNVVQIIVPRGKTVTGNFYATECLPAVEKMYKSIRPSRACKGMRLLHDNARPHKTSQVKEKIQNMGLIELEHPPYSPDLSPCDFWLFDILKKSLGDILITMSKLERRFISASKISPKMSTERPFTSGLKDFNFV